MQNSNTPTSFTLKDLFFMPVGCLLTASPYLILGGVIIAALVGLFLYSNVNIDLFGMGAPDFADMKSDPRFEKISIGDENWVIRYESPNLSHYNGLVRHVSPIRQDHIQLLTHDILVTSGEFSDSDKVVTNVADHHFTWMTRSSTRPKGTINLLHTVPWNQTIYQQLLSVQNGQTVSITGLEILRIDALDAQGIPFLWWQDSGCNTLLVTSVTILTK